MRLGLTLKIGKDQGSEESVDVLATPSKGQDDISDPLFIPNEGARPVLLSSFYHALDRQLLGNGPTVISFSHCLPLAAAAWPTPELGLPTRPCRGCLPRPASAWRRLPSPESIGSGWCRRPGRPKATRW